MKMLRWIVTICLVLSPSIIRGTPQSAVPNRYETEQDYTDSPDAKLVSSYPEIQTEKSATAKQFPKQYKPRGRFQQQYPNQQQQQSQSQEQYQQYQANYQTPAQFQSTTFAPASQYEQQNQYESQYISQPKYLQQSAHREHRPTTTTFIPIIRMEKTQALDGTYQQSWETGNNIIASENGYLKHIKDDQDALVQTGNYTYTAPDGSVVWTSYTADEGGFKVSGSHIPTPPPIPEEIRRGLQQIYEGIRLQQEAEAREAKSGKKKPISDEDNSIIPENYPTQSDNYPPQFRYYQQQQQQTPPQQPQQYRQPQLPQYQQQQQQQPPQHQEQPQTYRPIVAQPFRKVQKTQRPQSQQYQQFPESQRIQQNQESSQVEQ